MALRGGRRRKEEALALDSFQTTLPQEAHLEVAFHSKVTPRLKVMRGPPGVGTTSTKLERYAS